MTLARDRLADPDRVVQPRGAAAGVRAPDSDASNFLQRALRAPRATLTRLSSRLEKKRASETAALQRSPRSSRRNGFVEPRAAERGGRCGPSAGHVWPMGGPRDRKSTRL